MRYGTNVQAHAGWILTALLALWSVCPVMGATPWRFVAIGDSRGASTVINTDIVTELAIAITNDRPELLIFMGDLVLGPGDESQFATWTNAMAPVYQAGIAVYERGPSGKLANARVYDDVTPPFD